MTTEIGLLSRKKNLIKLLCGNERRIEKYMYRNSITGMRIPINVMVPYNRNTAQVVEVAERCPSMVVSDVVYNTLVTSTKSLVLEIITIC